MSRDLENLHRVSYFRQSIWQKCNSSETALAQNMRRPRAHGNCNLDHVSTAERLLVQIKKAVRSRAGWCERVVKLLQEKKTVIMRLAIIKMRYT